MKKTVILVVLLLTLVGCKANPKKMYRLRVNETNQIVVGADSPSVLEDLDYINDFSTFKDKKDREFLQSIEVYVKDHDYNYYINDYLLTSSIEENCINLKGELINKNGKACLLHKTYKKKENIVILTGDILSENIDELDRIQIMYN